jgi:iron complex outermembrane receptor protein
MNRAPCRGLFAGVSAICLLGATGPALAQDTGEVVEDIVVTATKRETNLQSTSLALSAIDGETLIEQQVTGIEGLAQMMPNVNFGQTTGNARISVRGVGFDNLSVGNEGRVAFHVDGIYLSRPAGALTTLYDIERVEVLRGPQGTLYGRNATGGAVNVIPNGPTRESEGYLNATLGNYNLRRFEGALSGPLSDSVSARIAFQTADRDGYGRNITNGLDIDDLSTRAVRGAVRFDLSPSADLTLSADYMEQDDHAYGFVLMGPGSLPDAGLGLPGAPLKGVLQGGAVATNPRDSASDIGPFNNREFWGVGAELNLDLGGVDFTSVSGYRSSSWRLTSDLDGTSARMTYYEQLENSEQLSQEFRLSGEWGGGDWMLGAYYFKEEMFGGTLIPFDPSVLTPVAPLPPLTSLRQGFFGLGYIDTEATALFGHLRFQFNDAWALRLGGRYSEETKDIDEVNKIDPVTPWPPYVPVFPPTPPGARQTTSASWSGFTPSLTLEYQPNEDLFLYATYSEGFKSGGFNLGNAQPPFGEEEITAYEVGLRADWMNGRLRTNLTGFYYEYANLQVSKVNGPVVTIENAAEASLYGAEFEITALPTDNLRIDANIALLESEYENYTSVDPSRALLGPIDLSGNQLYQAPGYTVNLAVSYEIPTSIGDFTLRGEGRWIDQVYFSPFNLDHVSQPAHEVFNAFLLYDAPSGNWNASLFARNIADDRSVSSALVGSGLVGFPLVGSYDPPRTYGVQLGYRF